MSSTERTPLRSAENVPSYVFFTSPTRRYRKQALQFKCCMMASVLAVFVLAVVITVSLALNYDTEYDTNSSAPTNASLISLLAITWPLPDISNDEWPQPIPGDAEVEGALIFGQQQLQEKDELEDQIPRLKVDTPSYRHYTATKSSARAAKLSRSGYILNVATKVLYNRTTHGGSIGMGPVIHADGLDESICPAIENEASKNCKQSSFRQPDGSCNNLKHPYKWGVAFRPFRRSLPPDYGDGISSPRLASDGTLLPSAREVSTTVNRPEYHDDSEFTVMLAVWGQFIDHDITDTAVGVAKEGKPFSCCTEQTVSHPECFPVALSGEDPYYNQWNISCMEFIRSAPAPTCYLGPREQLNQATSYIDGSVLYGILDSVTNDLRSYKGGELRMLETEDGRTLLPIDIDPVNGCNQEDEMKRGRYCFVSGDARSNENLHLVTMHLIWARQHNKIAKQLSSMNPSWSDERLFQESKKIVSAQLQHITYNEMLPILFGEKLMSQLDLSPKEKGYFTGYNGSVDASIANQFAAATYRFGHTLLPGLIKFINNDSSSEEYAELHTMLFDPFRLYDPGSLDKTLHGSFMTHARKFNTHFSREVTERLFLRGSAPCGLDLVSLTIQRGRDHGLPGYPAWRELCGFRRPKSFHDLNEVMDPKSLINLSKLYKSVEDIDLFTGALSEYPIKGGLVGPTITCLLADQFLRLKIGDRFWYETPEQPQAFTPDQLDEIRKTSLAGIICDNGDSLTSSQPYVMRITDSKNLRVPCTDIPRPDLSSWKETDGVFTQLGRSHVNIGQNTMKLRFIDVQKENLHLLVSVNNISISGKSEMWNLTLPLSLPIKPYSMSLFKVPVLWQGTISNVSTEGIITLQGRFSKSAHASSSRWYNGNCTIQVSPISNVTEKTMLPVAGTYKVYFDLKNNEQCNEENIESLFLLENKNWDSEYTSSTAISPENLTGKIYVLLHGTYSGSKSFFIWPGNATIILKKFSIIDGNSSVNSLEI